MLGKALSLVVVAALVAAGVVHASTPTRVWVGQIARGGDLSFLRAGNRIRNVQAELPVTCANEGEATQRESKQQIGFEKVLRIAARGRIRTTQRYDGTTERWTLTLAGTVGATRARGTMTWSYESASTGYSCAGKGSSRWTARRDRPVADPF